MSCSLAYHKSKLFWSYKSKSIISVFSKMIVSKIKINQIKTEFFSFIMPKIEIINFDLWSQHRFSLG